MWSRRSVHFAVLLVALVVAVSDAVSEPTFPVPPSGQFINDTAGLISSEDRSKVDRIAASLLAERGYPIAVVTIRSLAAQGAGAGYTVERYAAELLRSWPQEGSMRSHGMLLVVAADNRGARIQLGSAWGNAHDDRARRVMDRLILPAFRNGQFSTGILDGVRGFDAMGRQLTLPAVGRPKWMPSALVVEGLDGPWWTLPALVAGALVVLVGLVSLVRGGRRSWAWAAAAFIFALVLSRFLGGSAEASGSGGGASGEW